MDMCQQKGSAGSLRYLVPLPSPYQWLDLEAQSRQMLCTNFPKVYCPSDRPDGAFYLTPLKDCWFSCVPIGRNKLSTTVCKLAGISGFKTNHSLRATAATRLYSSGVDEHLVMERTGHRSIKGIRSYKRTSGEQQEAVSDILSNCKKKPALIFTALSSSITATATVTTTISLFFHCQYEHAHSRFNPTCRVVLLQWIHKH